MMFTILQVNSLAVQHCCKFLFWLFITITACFSAVTGYFVIAVTVFGGHHLI